MWCLSLSLVFAQEPDRSLSDELSARIEALEAVLVEGEEPEARVQLGWALLEALQPEAAVEQVQPLLVEDRGHVEARMLRAHAWQMLGDPDRGIAELDLIQHLERSHVPSDPERRLRTELELALGIQKGLPDQGEDAERVRACVEGLSSGRALESFQGCLQESLAEDLTRNLHVEEHVWAAEQLSRSLSEQLFRNAWMEPRGSRVVEHPDGRVEIWVWTEVRPEQGLFELLIEGGICSEGCSDLPLGGSWRRLDGPGRERLLEANSERPLFQLQGFSLDFDEEQRLRDVVLLSGSPSVENLGSVLASSTLRGEALGVEPEEEPRPLEQVQAPETASLRERLYQGLTALAVLLLIGLSVWIWRGGREEPPSEERESPRP